MTLTALDGAPVKIGGVRGGRSQLVLFLSPDCAVCEALLPALRSAHGAERGWLDIVLASDGEASKHAQFVRDKGLTKFPYVLSEQLGRSYGVAKLPYAVLIDEAGKTVRDRTGQYARAFGKPVRSQGKRCQQHPAIPRSA